MTTEQRFPFDAIAEMCERLGVSNIGLMDGCWTYIVDDNWWIAVNGHREPIVAISPTDREYNRKGTEVPPFHAYIEFNGWPAGFITPFDGLIAAGAAANPETFMAACDAVARKQ